MIRSTTHTTARPPETPVTIGVTAVLSLTGSLQKVAVKFRAAEQNGQFDISPKGRRPILTEALFD